MNPPLRVKLIGEERELAHVRAALNEKGSVFSNFFDLDDACESQETDPADIFVLGASNYFQSSLNQIQKLTPEPEVILSALDRIPNLAKIIAPLAIAADTRTEEIVWYLEHAGELAKRRRRLVALRNHQQRSWGQESNPAINLVTNVMRKCTIAEDFPDLLASILSLKSVIDFQDCSLISTDSAGNILNAWHGTHEGKDKFVKLSPIPPAFPAEIVGDSGVSMIAGAEPGSRMWNDFTLHPWSSGMVISFSASQAPCKPGIAKHGHVVLFRRELVPFIERDIWLFELTSGPLALALEKIVMLKMIGQASKEWRSTFDGISEPLTVIDNTYQIVKANKSFATLVDQDIKKLKGRRCYTLLANRRSPCVGCPVNAEAPTQSGNRLQISSKTKKDLLAWSYGIRTKMESYHFQFYRNVSKETTLASTLIQSEKMAALGRLVGAVAHEINNPLAGILATSQILLQEDENIPISIRDDLEEIRSAAWRSKKIIDDLLGFTSPEEKITESALAVDVVATSLLFCKAALKDVKVTQDVHPGTPKIRVSVNGLQQVIFNLLTNAVHAMNGKGSIHIRIEPTNGEVLVAIRDQGPGIPAEKLKHIFDPFFTSKQEGRGTGLGLSIVKNLIQKMNARIEVESAIGKGTEFSIYLPAEA